MHCQSFADINWWIDVRQLLKCADSLIQNPNDTIQKVARKQWIDEKRTDQQNAKEPSLEFVLHSKISTSDERDYYIDERKCGPTSWEFQFSTHKTQSNCCQDHK